MLTADLTRREFSSRLASLFAFASVPHLRSTAISLSSPNEVSHAAEAIHQEITINATARRVYAALTDAKQFSALMAFSSVPKAPRAQISREVGGTFSVFGGHILGRHLELVPSQRIVQAWRVVDWEPGIYSIARFRLKDQGAKTTIVFDHTGFPNGLGEHLAAGWHQNYWQPLRKYLG